LQCDERFAELYARERVDRGDGPRKIRAALSERGVSGAHIDSALAPYSQEWIDRATNVAAQRFGSAAADSARERARRARFLDQRGFPADVIQRVTRYTTDED
jgi:regulatory protein